MKESYSHSWLKNTCNINKEEKIFVAVDGSYNMDNQKNVMLNMGYYNIKNKIPLDLTCDGTENRNREVQTLLQSLKDNPTKYTNYILIGDRAYFSYELIDFLIKNNIKFIIRARGNATNLESDKNTNNKKITEELRNNIRIIHYTDVYNKIIFSKHHKKKINSGKIYNVYVKNDCTLITNLTDENKYTND